MRVRGKKKTRKHQAYGFGGEGGIRIRDRNSQSAQYVENRHFQTTEEVNNLLVSPLFPLNPHLIVVKNVIGKKADIFECFSDRVKQLQHNMPSP